MRNHELDFRPGDHLTGGNTRIFANEPQQFHVKLQLYATDQPGGTSNLVDDDDSSGDQQTNHIKAQEEGTIEVGEMVRLNAVVRSGDGWNYAFLKDVLVSRRIGKKASGRGFGAKRESANAREITGARQPSRDPSNTKELTGDKVVHHYSNDDEVEPVYGESTVSELINSKDNQVLLVDENGCRNPTFQLLAPSHPYQASNDGLDVNFEFRAFIFENMDVKHDRLRISAKIIACQQLDDCRPVSLLYFFLLLFNLNSSSKFSPHRYKVTSLYKSYINYK